MCAAVVNDSYLTHTHTHTHITLHMRLQPMSDQPVAAGGVALHLCEWFMSMVCKVNDSLLFKRCHKVSQTPRRHFVCSSPSTLAFRAEHAYLPACEGWRSAFTTAGNDSRSLSLWQSFLSGCLSPYVRERKVIGGFGLEESQLISLWNHMIKLLRLAISEHQRRTGFDSCFSITEILL